MQDLKQSSILIVDDTPTNLAVLSDALVEAGFEVGVATSGEGAIKQIKYHPPDLVLLDVMMPGIDGFETCHQLKSNPETKDIPVILMTALSDADHKVKGFAAGAVDYITKPFQQEEVLARVRVHLQLRHLSRMLEQQNIQLKQLTETLEQKVEERTADLQKAQVQLVQTERLSSLGQLVAGVAHEINNPIGCISSNLSPAREYLSTITHVLQRYQQRYQATSADIEAEAEDLDLEFALEDLPKILDSMQSATSRIQDISVSLRNFSRADTSSHLAVDLHEGLDSTLLILRHRCKAYNKRPEILIEKHYSNLPRVECYPGQMNQVFMNILSNSIDAFDESFELSDAKPTLPPTITLSTWLTEQNRVVIQIRDNGPGMSEAVLHRLFDPFFTTKKLGKGTGLGMSISYQIITENHQGQLHCTSALHQGTEFTIEIPIHPQKP